MIHPPNAYLQLVAEARNDEALSALLAAEPLAVFKERGIQAADVAAAKALSEAELQQVSGGTGIPKRDAISIADMFEMQMMMNHLSQLSEMSSSVISASNAAISSMARNVKS